MITWVHRWMFILFNGTLLWLHYIDHIPIKYQLTQNYCQYKVLNQTLYKELNQIANYLALIDKLRPQKTVGLCIVSQCVWIKGIHLSFLSVIHNFYSFGLSYTFTKEVSKGCFAFGENFLKNFDIYYIYLFRVKYRLLSLFKLILLGLLTIN